MEIIQVKIKAKHFRESTSYTSNKTCPLAIALKEQFKTDNISVRGQGGGCLINNLWYLHNWSSTGLVDNDSNSIDDSIEVDDLIFKAKQKKKVGEFIVTLKKI